MDSLGWMKYKQATRNPLNDENNSFQNTFNAALSMN